MSLQINNSPTTCFKFNQQLFYLKRDDLLSPISGNKARKLYYYLINEFININTIISYGGDQSNYMYALSILAKIKGWQFIYYTRKNSATALNNVSGNLALSLNNGMQLISIENDFKNFCNELSIKSLQNQLVLSQGGFDKNAKYGLYQLAQEIRNWAKMMDFAKLSIFVASGTGTTAFYLQKFLPEFTLYTTNCIGNKEYLSGQFAILAAHGKKSLNYPIILDNQKYRFAVPNLQLNDLINQIMLASQVEFDLIYDPIGWKLLLDNISQINQPILYLHCGGVNGNVTMQKRYEYKFKAK